MNALTPAPDPAPSTVSPETLRISLPLRRLLESDLPRSQEVADIVRDPNLHRECRARADDLARVVQPGGEEAVERVLSELILHFRDAKDPAKAPAWWRGYHDLLAGLPAWALERAARDYLASPESEFFPKPGKLKDLAERHAIKPRQAAARAREAAAQAPVSTRPVSVEETDRIRAEVRELVEKGLGSGDRTFASRMVKPEEAR